MRSYKATLSTCRDQAQRCTTHIASLQSELETLQSQIVTLQREIVLEETSLETTRQQMVKVEAVISEHGLRSEALRAETDSLQVRVEER